MTNFRLWHPTYSFILLTDFDSLTTSLFVFTLSPEHFLLNFACMRLFLNGGQLLQLKTKSCEWSVLGSWQSHKSNWKWQLKSSVLKRNVNRWTVSANSCLQNVTRGIQTACVCFSKPDKKKTLTWLTERETGGSARLTAPNIKFNCFFH